MTSEKGSSVWTMLVDPREVCANCRQHKDYHIDGQCPFEASLFVPSGDLPLDKWKSDPGVTHRWISLPYVQTPRPGDMELLSKDQGRKALRDRAFRQSSVEAVRLKNRARR